MQVFKAFVFAFVTCEAQYVFFVSFDESVAVEILS